MKSQNPNDWQLPLSQLPIDSDQPSTSKRCIRDEAGPFERHIQPQIEPCIPKNLVPILQLENKALVIVLESEPILFKSYQMVFEGCFENNTEEQMVSHISGDGGHRLWFQGSLILLIKERRTNYVVAMLLCILEFLSV